MIDLYAERCKRYIISLEEQLILSVNIYWSSQLVNRFSGYMYFLMSITHMKAGDWLYKVALLVLISYLILRNWHEMAVTFSCLKCIDCFETISGHLSSYISTFSSMKGLIPCYLGIYYICFNPNLLQSSHQSCLR